MKLQHLFVYGTLKKGEKNARLFDQIGGTWRSASVRGKLYPQGVAGTSGFPALVLDQNEKPVQGLVFSCSTFARWWPLLDDFEGEGYRRIKTQVKLKSGSNIEAFVYVPASEIETNGK